ncbi:biotin--[acetyl-CoA-carboxylase] ligase [Ornithinimicrobium sediminis]|uniref:biotin--[acetyl-CoA-carboxylase] ligase n=1 Tax=Ornithinimicrobium sediminis TaxID=2904603 RepID=UPI001E36598B|nr:biotin--[acetyl-CoA-carboxylase] ligase [Ornithinimicrobium sediminis]
MQAHRWARPEWHRTIDSTQSALLRDPRPGRVVVAEHQSAGQGRRGRTWSAPPGAALAVSVALPAPRPEVVGWVPLLTGLAVVQALGAGPYAVPAALKWPNDVLVPQDGQWRKVCGILAQVVPAASAPGPVVVLGTGINLDQDREDLPVPTATSWRLACGSESLPPSARQAWLQDYLRALDGLLDLLERDPAALRAAYARRCRTLGQPVRVHLPDGSTEEGRAVGLDDSGALLVQSATGTRAHHAGDVVHLRHDRSTER